MSPKTQPMWIQDQVGYTLLSQTCQVREFFVKKEINIDLTPVGQHRRNKSERAIRTYKNHHIATVAGFDKDCPLELWSDSIDQIELTLNLLRTSPEGTSAWAAVHGAFDFNKTPIAPLGIKVVVHVPADKRASWDSHGDLGFYVGRAPEHYRCYKVWIQKTKAFRISDCLAWFPAATLTVSASGTPSTQQLTPSDGDTMGGKERVVTPPQVEQPPSNKPTMIIQNPAQLEHQKRHRDEAHYSDLTALELARLPVSTLSKIGKSFIDSDDAPDI